MELKTLLREDIEREHKYLNGQEVGSDEYNDSLKRLGALEDKLFECEKFESESASKEKQSKDEKRDRRIKNTIEIVKTASGIILPVVGLISIMGFEKEETFTSALKGYVNYFIPKKTV